MRARESLCVFLFVNESEEGQIERAQGKCTAYQLRAGKEDRETGKESTGKLATYQ